jgi:hypothetical protein
LPPAGRHDARLKPLTRRAFVGAAGAFGVLALAPPARVRALLASAAAAPGQPGRFLTAHELDTLRALTDRLIPGPPEDPTPGALDAGVAEAIDLLLGAFEVRPPLIHAGGPFSDRAGSRRDDFAEFVALDRQAELGWRIRLEGSRGLPEREFAGPVVGLQQIYRDGLAHLDGLGQKKDQVPFAQASAQSRDAILGDAGDASLQGFLAAALANTVEAMYGPPEYGGNRDLVGWTSNGWAGDNQPRGYSRTRVTTPDPAPPARAAATLDHPLPPLSGRAAPRDAPWLRRGGLGRP